MARQTSTEIVDDDLGTARSQQQGMRSPQPAPAPVTRATRPSNLIMSEILSVFHCTAGTSRVRRHEECGTPSRVSIGGAVFAHMCSLLRTAAVAPPGRLLAC